MYDVKFLADHEKEVSKGIITDECINDILELYQIQDESIYKDISSFDFYLFDTICIGFFEFIDDEFIDYKKFKQRIKAKDISIYKKTTNILQQHYKQNLIHIKNALYNAFLDLYYDDESNRNKPHSCGYFKYYSFSYINTIIKNHGMPYTKFKEDLDKVFYDALKHTGLKFDNETIETMYKYVFRKF